MFALLTSASLAMVDGFIATAVESFLAVVAVASVRVVATLDAHASAEVS